MTKHIFSAVVLALPFTTLAFLSGCDPNPPPIDQDAGQDAGQDASVELDGAGPTSSSPIVIGGTFNRGADPASPAIVDNFRLDKYEITVGRFRSFVVAWDGGWRPQAGSGKHSHLNEGRGVVGITGEYETGWDAAWASYVGASSTDAVVPNGSGATLRFEWDTVLVCSNILSDNTWTSSPNSHEVLPQNCLSWYDTYAFCIWDGGFLPTETEWEYAAAGGAENRTYPWGAAWPDSTRAIFLDGMPGPVGGTPDGNGKWGHADLAGNVREWVLDWNKSAYSVPCTNCGELTPDLYRDLRGGSWLEDGRLLSTTFRNFDAPAIRDARNGGRCARPAH